MSWVNYDDVLNQIRDGGLLVDGIEVDTTRPKRCRVDGGDHEARGWYWLTTKHICGQPYIVGAFGTYYGNDPGKRAIVIRRDGVRVTVSAEERASIAARHAANMKRIKARRQDEAARAAREAERIWRAYVPTGESDYLTRKGVAAHGLRYSPSGNGTLAVPMLRGDRIVGLQIIRGRGRGKKLEKQYWPKGLEKVGAYHLLGRPSRGATILVAEGYATAASIYEAMGFALPVAVAFDAGSLRPVACTLSKTYRSAHILICADDDYRTAGNPGVGAARDAAEAVGGAWVAPAFSEDRPTDGKGPTDFNDLHLKEGLHVVRRQVDAALSGLGWTAAQAPRARVSHEGGGGRAALVSVITLDEAAERFAMVYGTGGTWFDSAEHMLVPKADLQDILPEHGMRDLRAVKRVVRMEDVGFDPVGNDPRITCNLWGGWPTAAKPGCCERLLELLEYLCGNEPESRGVFDWVLKWLAYPVQHPGAKMRTALIFHGRQGTGKNLFFESYMSIYGEYGRIVDQSAIEDKFNDWASRKLFLIADEVVARAELYHIKNKLKGMVTGEWIRINPKNVAAHDERNHVNIVFLSNEKQPLVLEDDDRRYVVIWTPEKLPQEFYQEVRAEIDAGGREALHHYLLELDIGEFDEHTKPPLTDAKAKLIDRSLDSVERFLREWQAGDVLYSKRATASLPFCPCASAHLYAAYSEWCARANERPRPENQFGGDIQLRSGWVKAHRDRRESLHASRIVRQRFIVPSAHALTEAARSGRDDYQRRPEETQTDWLTRCFFAFAEAME